MDILSVAVECPTCGAEIGDQCVQDGQEIFREHPDRILQDVLQINLEISRASAERILKIVYADESEKDEGFLFELMCFEIDFARAMTAHLHA